MNMPMGAAVPDYRGMPLEDLDVSDPRMFQYDHWHDLFARLRQECATTCPSVPASAAVWVIVWLRCNCAYFGRKRYNALKP